MPSTQDNSKQNTPIKSAVILTLISMASTGVLLLWYALGPQTGMETLALIIPWFFALVIHVALTIPALMSAWKSRAHLALFWIYGYFLIFWIWHGWYFVVANQIDIQVARKMDTLQMPAETELSTALAQMRIDAFQHPDMDPARLARVKTLIEHGADVTYRPPGSHREMILDAAAIGDPDLLQLMLKKGADVEAGGLNSMSPLMEAVRAQKSRAAAALLQHGANPNHSRYNPDTPLMIAVRNRDTETVRVLLEGGALPDLHPQSSLPALQLAAGAGDAAVMKQLLTAGADPNRVVFGGSTAIIRAIEADCAACVRMLLDAGGRFIGKSRDGDGVLASAVNLDNPEIMAAILPEAENYRLPADRFGIETFDDMFRAIRKADWAALEIYLKAGAPPDMTDGDGKTLLLAIAGRKYVRPPLTPESEVEAARILSRHGANLDAPDKWGKTALIHAAESGAVELGEWLVENHADVSAKSNPEGVTALMTAIWKGHDRLVAALLAAGANPNARTNMGMNSRTPLGAAVQKRNPELAIQLLEAGATMDAQRLVYEPVFSMALTSPRMMALLLSSGLDLNQQDIFGRYPLEVAMYKGSEATLRFLITSGAEPYLQDWRGVQPFLHFAKNGLADLVTLCLEKSALIRTDKKIQRNAMDLAMRHGRTAVVRALLEHDPVYERMASVNAVLQNATPPADDPTAIDDIRTLFENRLGPQTPEKKRRGSPVLMVLPNRK